MCFLMSWPLLYRNKMNTTSNGPPVYLYHDVGLVLASVSVNNVLGLPLNGYVVWLILAGASGTLTSDFFSLNLAISEILFSLFGMSYIVYSQLHHFAYFEVFVFSRGLLFTARPLFLCCICVECYLGVIHPVFFLRCKPLRYKVACGCVAWVITLISGIYSKYTYSNPLYMYGYFIQNLFIFFVMLCCCLSVLRALKRPGPGAKGTGKKKKSSPMKRRAFKIILIITISQVVHFFMFVAAIPLQCCLSNLVFSIVLTICTSFALTTGVVQPLLYLHRAGKLVCLGGF